MFQISHIDQIVRIENCPWYRIFDDTIVNILYTHLHLTLQITHSDGTSDSMIQAATFNTSHSDQISSYSDYLLSCMFRKRLHFSFLSDIVDKILVRRTFDILQYHGDMKQRKDMALMIHRIKPRKLMFSYFSFDSESKDFIHANAEESFKVLLDAKQTWPSVQELEVITWEVMGEAEDLHCAQKLFPNLQAMTLCEYTRKM